MRFTISGDDGVPVAFECGDTWVSRWVCGEILEGKTYPFLPFVHDVRVVFDVGANCGAASVYFARHYPDAIVHAFEPGAEPRAFLERNAACYPNVSVHPFGLFSTDQAATLYKGDGDTILGSVFRRPVNLEASEPIELRAAGPWVQQAGIDRIDVLKIDVEGCEVDVIESLAPFLPTVKVLYIEYDSIQARRTIDRLLDQTHDLYIGLAFLDEGACLYLRNDIAALDTSTEHLRSLWRPYFAAHPRSGHLAHARVSCRSSHDDSCSG